MAKTKRLPSRRVIFTVLIAVVVLVIVGYRNSDSYLYHKEILLSGNFLSGAVTKTGPSLPDQDSDGLQDWEELLFGTSASNPDSDRNGVLDGEQYASLKKLPRVEISDSSINYIGQLSQALSGSAGPTIPEPRFTRKENLYFTKSLTIVPSTQESRNEYVVFLMVILAGKYPELFEDNILETVALWVETKDEDGLREIKQREKTLRLAATDLSLLETPVDAVPVHLDIINNLYKESLSLNEIMAVTIENPAQGLLASAQYADYRSKRAKSIAELGNYFNTAKY